MRTFGMEEEFFIINPLTGLPCAPSASARAELLELTVGGTNTVGEFLACQVESNSPVCTEGAAALATVRNYRAALSRATIDLGLRVVALGTPPRIPDAPAVVTPTDRYRAITSLCEGIATEHYLSGLHVHVGIEDPESGVIALNELRRWLPVLTACGSNSPYWRGGDTGFASWRNIHYRRWAIQGIPPHFLDLPDYQRRMQFMLDSDVVLDSGHISWGAPPVIPPLADVLDLAQWQAAKFGLQGNHVDPLDGKKTSAVNMLRILMDHIQHALKRNGDADYVSAGLTRLVDQGTGAGIQRDRFHHGGFNAVLDEAEAAIAA